MRFEVTYAVDLKHKIDGKIGINLYCDNYAFRCDMIDIKRDIKRTKW